jgi:hypothetical protein
VDDVLKSDSNAAVLLAHDGELDDVRDLLSGLGLAFVERRCEAGPDDLDRPWALVVATPRRLLKLDLRPEPGSRRVQIAIGDTDSRTLRKTMSLMNIDFFVRRPVHSEALRLLIVHALYQGPERRRTRRVPVGAPVRFRTALRRRSAILVDLSETGCRLMSECAADPGLSIKLSIPTGRNTSTLLSVQGTVIRTYPAVSGPPGSRVMRVIFDDLSREQKSRLRMIVDEFAEGPASFAGEHEAEGGYDENLPADLESSEEDWSQAPLPAELERKRADWSSAPVTADPAATATVPVPRAATAPDSSGDSADFESNRRTEPRRIFSRQIVALANDKSRVLIARDLSVGGMRTNRDPNVAVGDELTVALPLVDGQVPLVIKARVIRDDGESGLVLQFRDVSEKAAAFLREKSSFLPICDSPFEEEEPAWVIVSEILEPRAD